MIPLAETIGTECTNCKFDWTFFCVCVALLACGVLMMYWGIKNEWERRKRIREAEESY